MASRIVRRDFIKTAMLAAGALATGPKGRDAHAQSSAARPNILIFVADDVSYDFGCYGNDAITTPNLDGLAENGLKATKAFLTCPQCSPSRISVLTGMYPHTTRTEDLHTPIPEGRRMLPSYLGEAGYYTGHMRKQHYGKHGSDQFDWYAKNFTEFPKFLDAAEDNPFFMWVGFVDAHRDYQEGAFDPPHDPAKVKVPPFLVDSESTRKDLAMYYDEVARMDKNIGIMVQELRDRGQLDNTLIIFFCDNGMPFPRAKGSLYDSGIGTPLIFHWPKTIAPGKTYDGLTSVVDLAPTLLEIAGVSGAPGMEDIQGESIARIFTDPTTPGRSHVFSERNWHDCDEHMRSVRTDRYKLIRNAYLDKPHGTAADLARSPSQAELRKANDEGTLTPQQAQLFAAPRPEYELYDTVNDPWEFNNLAEDPTMAKTFADLKAKLQDWSESTDDFAPEFRRRLDASDRLTGERYIKGVPDLTNPLP